MRYKYSDIEKLPKKKLTEIKILPDWLKTGIRGN